MKNLTSVEKVKIFQWLCEFESTPQVHQASEKISTYTYKHNFAFQISNMMQHIEREDFADVSRDEQMKTFRK